MKSTYRKKEKQDHENSKTLTVEWKKANTRPKEKVTKQLLILINENF